MELLKLFLKFSLIYTIVGQLKIFFFALVDDTSYASFSFLAILMAHGLWVEWLHSLRRLLDPCLNDRLEDGSVVKNPLANVGDTGSIPESGRSPGGGNDNPFQYSWLENFTDSRAWQATVHGVTKSQTWLSTHACNIHKSPPLWASLPLSHPTFLGHHRAAKTLPFFSCILEETTVILWKCIICINI